MDKWLEEQILKISDRNEQKVLDLRHQIHQDPELSFKEFHTAERVKKILEDMGLEVRSGIAKTGLTADIVGEKAGEQPKTLLLRADMDALPIQEENELPFCSQNPGVMHACGHDVHTSSLVGVAWILNELKEHWSGRVRLVFQPAEESGGGGREMIKEGIMDDIPIDGSIALHTLTSEKPGTFFLGWENVSAYSDKFQIVVHGKKTHSAAPQNGIDAIEIAAHVVLAVSGLLKNSISPMERATYSIGMIQGGTAPNIIADRVELTGMMRNIKSDTRQILRDKIGKVAAGVAEAMGGSAEFIFTEGYSSVYNDPKLTDFVAEQIKKQAGAWLADIDPEMAADDNYLKVQKLPMLGAEDYGFYTQRVPSCFYRVGTGNSAPAHSGRFFIEEKYVKLCTRSMASLALRYLMDYDKTH